MEVTTCRVNPFCDRHRATANDESA